MARVAILTASDRGSLGERKDESGDALAQRLTAAGHILTARQLVPDERARIRTVLREWCDGNIADAIVTTGGTGLTERDVTPEATRDIGEREVPGIVTALIVAGLKNTPYAALSRGIAVTRGRTLIVNLPGSVKAVGEGMDVLLPLLDHVAALLAGPVEHGSDSRG